MRAASFFDRRVARVGLILAALLHLLGAAGEVWLHARAPLPVVHDAVVITGTPDERSGVPTHSAQSCVVGQLFGAHAVPGTAPVVADRLAERAPAVTPSAPPRAHGHPHTTLPRAPPVA